MDKKQTVTAELIAQAYKRANPEMRFAHHDDAVVGIFQPAVSRFVMIFAKTITGQWVDVRGHEVLVNGQPPVKNSEWIEV